jgi:chemotaxis protein methyltransferase CheR
LGLPDLAAYRAYLTAHPEEWAVPEGLVHITISRFNRDRAMFDLLAREVLPVLARDAAKRGSGPVEAWSAGCASGEEAYTLAIVWQLEFAARAPGVTIRIVATDVDETVLARARQACYGAGSLREAPERWRAAAFVEREGRYCVSSPYRESVRILRHDIREEPPGGPFDLVLCRNLTFTYFDEAGQRATATRLALALRAGGGLVVGTHEALPAGVEGFEPWSAGERIYRRVGADVSGVGGTRDTGTRITPSPGSPSAERAPSSAITPVRAPSAASTRSGVGS